MLRLGKSFALTMLAAASLVIPSLPARGQATAPQTAMPQASSAARTVPSSTSPAPKARARHKQAARVAETPPAPPPPSPTLEQSPPTAPRVSLQNGQLTIDAPNSTLTQILRAVQARTGASMDIPSGAANERVVAQLGPGLPRDVLNTLLNGSRFDYVILGVTGDPGGVQKVILTPRQGGGAAPTVNTAQNNNPQPAQDEDPGDEGVPVADTAENEYQNPDQPPPPPGGFRRPMMPGAQQVDPGAQFGGGEQQQGPKTPEQLMQEMQQLQQQQMMYNQQLNPANQQPQQQ